MKDIELDAETKALLLEAASEVQAEEKKTQQPTSASKGINFAKSIGKGALDLAYGGVKGALFDPVIGATQAINDVTVKSPIINDWANNINADYRNFTGDSGAAQTGNFIGNVGSSIAGGALLKPLQALLKGGNFLDALKASAAL